MFTENDEGAFMTSDKQAHTLPDGWFPFAWKKT